MYCAVPTTAPARVSALGASLARAERASSVSLEIPKSRILDGERAVVALSEKEVGGLEIAMDDAGGVRLCEGARGLDADVHGERHFDAAVALETHGQVFARQVLHDHVEADDRIGPDIEDSDDVVALHLAGRAGLTTEALRDLG